MQRHTSAISALTLAAACGLSASTSLATPPTFTITEVARSGNIISNPVDSSNLGPINQIGGHFGGPPGAQGFFGAAVNSSGSWLLDADTYHSAISTTHEALLRTQPIGTLYSPYVVQGFSGYMSAPTPATIMTSVLGMSMNNAGDSAIAMAWAPDDTCTGCSSTGVFFNNTRAVFLQGGTLTAAGLAAGTTWDAFTSSTCLRLVATNRLLVVSHVTESGVHRRIVLVAQLDSTGNVQSTTLLAKEGGPVGAGPATWTTIAPGAQAASMNASGTVAFSGTTSAGAEGVYSTAAGGAFVAVSGGPTPVAGTNWGTLAGSSVDINSAGVVAFRGYTAIGSGTFTEAGDAGDLVDSENHTFGNEPLTLITGTLSNDQDVDMYRITVTDPATFSATTVPNPGAGFAGAAFDTVLTLIAEPGNGTTGKTQCDDAAPGVMQSTITGMGGNPTVAGRSYYLAISTPKSRPQGRIAYWSSNPNLYVGRDMWQTDPSGLAVIAGLVYWPVPSAGVIRRATTSGTIQTDLSTPAAGSFVAVDGTGGKVYWIDQTSSSQIWRSNLDGSVVEALSSTNAFNDPYGNSYDVTGFAIDSVHGYVYWSRAVEGEINRMDLNGANPTRIIQDYPPTSSSFPAASPTGTFSPEVIAIDTSAGASNKIYWYNANQNFIERCNLDGTGRAPFMVGGNTVGAGAGGLAIDSAAGKLYWTKTSSGKVQRANLSGSGTVEDVVLSSAPVAIALDTSAGMVYWTNTVDRKVRRASIAGALPASASDVVYVGGNVGERAPDGQAKSVGFDSWARIGTPESTALPYQIKLTGAGFQYAKSMLVKGNQRIAGVGDAVGGVASSTLSEIETNNSPLRITDRGDVIWLGRYLAPSMYINHVFDGLLFNQDLLMASDQTPTITNASGASVVFFWTGPRAFDASTDGGYVIIPTNMSTASFVQPDYALLFQFTYPASSGACCNGTHCSVGTQAACAGVYQGDSSVCGPAGNPTTCCPANFNGVNGLSVQDIFDFLNAWFASDPSADFNHTGGLGVQDIFDFLNAWFAGC